MENIDLYDGMLDMKQYIHFLGYKELGDEQIMPLDRATLDEIFTYHSPLPQDIDKYTRIRNAAKEFAIVIVENTPRCADQTTAIRHVREAVMNANSSIALQGLI